MEAVKGASVLHRLASPFIRALDCDDTFSLTSNNPLSLKIRIAAAVAAGLIAAVVSAAMTHPIRFQGDWVGDIGPPIVGVKLYLDGVSPYAFSLREGAITLYPFTTSVVLSPFLLIPTVLWAPLFSSLTTALLAFGIVSKGRPWQLLALLSPCYMTAMHSVQWSPVLTASLMLPLLLPLAVVKPQIGLVLAASGEWRPVPIGIAIGIVALSIALLPTWPLAWIAQGNLELYAGTAPFTIVPGFLLLSSGFLWRKRPQGQPEINHQKKYWCDDDPG